MDTREIRCPSGLRGRIRKMSGRDFHRLLIDSPGDTTPDQMADLAEAVWMETIDPGPYRLNGDKLMFRSDVLIGDRSYILVQSRCFTSGGKRDIRIQCEECTGWWQEPFDYAAMEIREWPDGDDLEPAEDIGDLYLPAHKAWVARKRFAAGEPCSTVMPGGTTVQWNLLTGSLLSEQIQNFALQFGGSTFFTETAARIVSIEGIDLDQYTKPEDKRLAIFDWVTTYPDEDFWVLFNDIQDHECGPEPDVFKRCAVPLAACGYEFGYTVDIMGFIVPSLPKRSLRLRAGARNRRT